MLRLEPNKKDSLPLEDSSKPPVTSLFASGLPVTPRKGGGEVSGSTQSTPLRAIANIPSFPPNTSSQLPKDSATTDEAPKQLKTSHDIKCSDLDESEGATSREGNEALDKTNQISHDILGKPFNRDSTAIIPKETDINDDTDNLFRQTIPEDLKTKMKSSAGEVGTEVCDNALDLTLGKAANDTRKVTLENLGAGDTNEDFK